MSQNSLKQMNSSNTTADGSGQTSSGSSALQVVRLTAPAVTVSPPAQSSKHQPAGIPPAGATLLDTQEEISTFFRNRHAAGHGYKSFGPILKICVFICVFTMSLLVAWNHVSPARVALFKFGQTYLGVRLTDYIPAWTKRAKTFERRADRKFGLHQPGARAFTPLGAVPVDSPYQLVVAGQWLKFEAEIAGKCSSWVVSPACAYKAWYAAYRGGTKDLRPILNFRRESLSVLPRREQSVFLFASSAAQEGSQADRYFKDAVNLVANDPMHQRMLFDARYKHLLRTGTNTQRRDLIQLFKLSSSNAADISRWAALDLAQTPVAKVLSLTADEKSNLAKKMNDTMQQNVRQLSGDPLAFVAIANFGLSVGSVRSIIGPAVSQAEESFKLKMDPGIRRELVLLAARSLFLNGEHPKAIQLLRLLHQKDGGHALVSHMQGAIFLDMKGSDQFQGALDSFRQAVRMNDAWQSQVGVLAALVRAGKLREAAPVATSLSARQNPENWHWIKLALAEYKLAAARAKGAGRQDSYQQLAKSLEQFYSSHPQWLSVSRIYFEALSGSGRHEEARIVRSKIDELDAGIDQRSSYDFLASPTGPFVVLR